MARSPAVGNKPRRRREHPHESTRHRRGWGGVARERLLRCYGVSGIISIAPQGHSSTQMPQPLQ